MHLDDHKSEQMDVYTILGLEPEDEPIAPTLVEPNMSALTEEEHKILDDMNEMLSEHAASTGLDS